MNTATTWEHGTSTERIATVRRYAAERRAKATELRGNAIGNTVDGAKWCLQNAQDCESVAVGMERALAILFP